MVWKSAKAQRTRHGVALSAVSGNLYVLACQETRGGFSVGKNNLQKSMFTFIKLAFTKVTSLVATLLVSVGLMSAPQPVAPVADTSPISSQQSEATTTQESDQAT